MSGAILSGTAEVLTWHDARVTLPDSDQTVLVHQLTGSEPVWLSADAWEIEVSHWAEIPKGPQP